MGSQNELNMSQQPFADKNAQTFPGILVCYLEELWNNPSSSLILVRLQPEQCVQF